MTPQAAPEAKIADIAYIPFIQMDWRLKREGRKHRNESEWVYYHTDQLIRCKEGSIDKCYDVAIQNIAWPEALPNKREEFLKLKNLYKSACKVNHLAGCLNTALVHRYGDAEDVDHKKSRDMLNSICDDHVTDDATVACTEIGRQILSDLNSETNETIADAIRYFELACDANEPRACTILSYMYQHGEKLNQNIQASPEKSLKLIEKACDVSDNKWACYQKSLRYAAGETKVDRDVIRGKLGLSMACDQGIRKACKGFDRFDPDIDWKFDSSIK